jgi:NADPH-dependent 2,4-dienoyl-CoA reductase/sulfur reductase-like enzyme/rhodanese-related sulfurtransferase
VAEAVAPKERRPIVAAKMRILIVGGVAGGASCAARARRLSEEAEIIIFDRGDYVSFANCGLPYYVGNVIKEEKSLLVATPELFMKRFRIDVRLRSEVTTIDRGKSEIEVRDLLTGNRYRERYDALVLSPGAAPVKPLLPGIDLAGIFTLRTIPDTRLIRDWIEQSQAKRALVVGGGFIGLEMTENFVRRGLGVTIVEMQPHLMPALDPEMATSIHERLIQRGVALRLNDSVVRFERGAAGGIAVGLKSGESEVTDLVILSVGVRPETKLAKEAGLELGERGGIRVDDHLRTSDERIWAVGDAVEVRDVVTGLWSVVPLAGPANRQGRSAADVILGRDSTFRGVQATVVCGILGLTVAATGPSEKSLRRLGLWDQPASLEKIYLHPGQHASYYPGASPITMKLIFSRADGRVVGAQAVGAEGVEKRIDVISMAIQKKATVFDLEEAELCYSPQFGSAKDPVNLAGLIAANVMRGDARIVQWEDINRRKALILDVREPLEFEADHLEGAVNIPLGDLRERMGALPRDREILTYCTVGQRSYYAARALAQHGFDVKNISGGFKLFLLREDVV